MLDRAARRLVDPPLERLAAACAERRIGANTVTLIGFGCGLVAMGLAASQYYILALAALALNRIADGLDGALARRTRVTDLGGYLDIVLDFIFYAGFVLAFALAEPTRGIAAAFLIFSFVGTGTSFLAFAVFEAKRGRVSTDKSFYYLSGLTEGTETILLFVFLCLFPAAFSPAAWLFGIACWLTTLGRVLTAVREFR
jgi:phosphatidylglycerophosphate synthase